MEDPGARDDVIDLARFAAVAAHLRHFAEAPAAEVLARLGLGRARWEAAEARWYAARDAELVTGATEMTRCFGRAFAEALRELERRRPSLEALGPLAPPAPPAIEVAPAAPIAPPAPVLAAPPTDVRVVEAPRVHHLAATADISAAIPRHELPFATGEAAASGASVSARPLYEAASKRPTPSIDAARPAHLDQTVGLAPGAGAAPALPPGLPDLTLPQYASLRVEIHVSPEATDAIAARYGVRREAMGALDAHFRARFEADPLLRMEFVRAYAVYLGWLRQHRG